MTDKELENKIAFQTYLDAYQRAVDLQLKTFYPVLDSGSVELIDVLPHTETSADLAVVQAARISYNRETKGLTADFKLIDYLMKNRHMTPFEMVTFKFKIVCPLFVRSQWMRHRTASYNEISRRYTHERINFHKPTYWRVQHPSSKQSSEDVPVQDNDDLQEKYTAFLDFAKALYDEMLAKGVAHEQARYVLPTSTYTSFFVQVNLRNLLDFISQRAHPHAQQEIQAYAIRLFKIVALIAPETLKAFVRHQQPHLQIHLPESLNEAQ